MASYIFVGNGMSINMVKILPWFAPKIFHQPWCIVSLNMAISSKDMAIGKNNIQYDCKQSQNLETWWCDYTGHWWSPHRKKSSDTELSCFFVVGLNKQMMKQSTITKAHFLSLALSKLRLWSANYRAGYFSNLACDWLSIVGAYSEQETENGSWILLWHHCNILLWINPTRSF